MIVEAGSRSPVLPARFGTIFASRDSLEQRLDEHRDAILAFLDRVTDQEEWAVKGYLDKARAAAALEDDIRIIDEDHAWGVVSGGVENAR